MVFAKHLRIIGDEFRAKYLNSTDKQDQTPYNEDWTKMKVCFTTLILPSHCSNTKKYWCHCCQHNRYSQTGVYATRWRIWALSELLFTCHYSAFLECLSCTLHPRSFQKCKAVIIAAWPFVNFWTRTGWAVLREALTWESTYVGRTSSGGTEKMCPASKEQWRRSVVSWRSSSFNKSLLPPMQTVKVQTLLKNWKKK